MSTQASARALGLSFSELLLPAAQIDLEKWAVIAVDQFTSEPSYWEAVAAHVGDAPSTLHLVQPEAFLAAQDEARVAAIHAAMRRYRETGVLHAYPDCAIYVRRTLAGGAVRRGVVIALDLEQYEFAPGSRSRVRASEETIPERLPARAAVRRNAPIETPHILVLYDDPEERVTARLEAAAGSLERAYATALMMGGGSVEGFRLSVEDAAAAGLIEALQALDAERTGDFLFAAGDGNHSLAAAKVVWNERKSAGAAPDDPARFCLVELVNVHDEGLPFEPIHRLVGVGEDRLLEALLHTSEARFHGIGEGSISELVTRERLSPRELAIVGPSRSGILVLPDGTDTPVAAADRAIEAAGATAVDYVHGTEDVLMLAAERNEVALILPPFPRDALFPTVAERGTLPRKAFSLGEARDKRYYLECRALTR